MKFDAEITTETVEGICTYDLAFFKDAKAKGTHKFNVSVFDEKAKQGTMSEYIDVDEDNKPVAVTFMHPQELKVPYTGKTVEELYEHAAKLAAAKERRK